MGYNVYGLEVIKLVIYSTQLDSTEYEIDPAHNVKMPTTIGILTFISRINTTGMSFKTRNIFIFQHFRFD